MPKKQYPYDPYGTSPIRVILDSDCACEGDDAFAIAQALLTTKLDIRAINATNFAHQQDSVERSYEAIQMLLSIMEPGKHIPVLKGAPAMESKTCYEENEASDFIIEEALRQDDRPLFLLAQGAVTNLAIALCKKPEIAEKLTCIWIGGAAYPEGGWEFNLCNDITAARILMESPIPLWQIPSNIYTQMVISFATLSQKLYPCGTPGKYLCEQLWEVNKQVQDRRKAEQKKSRKPTSPDLATGYGSGEFWILGDSPVVGFLLFAQSGRRIETGSPVILDDGSYKLRPDYHRRILVYQSIDPAFIFDDFFAKMQYQYGE